MTDPEDTKTSPLVEATRKRLDYDKHRDWALLLFVAAIFTLLLWREVRLADESEQKQEARATAVGLAAQVQAECEDPAINVGLAICRAATEIIEDPENPEAPPMPEAGPPGEDAPPPSDEQVARVLRDLLPEQVPPAVNNYFETNPPEGGGLTEAQVQALIADLVPTAGEVAALVPPGEDGTDGTDGTDGRPGPACPNGATPIRWHFPGTANIDLPEGTYLICPAG